jgi:hypothetical protein
MFISVFEKYESTGGYVSVILSRIIKKNQDTMHVLCLLRVPRYCDCDCDRDRDCVLCISMYVCGGGDVVPIWVRIKSMCVCVCVHIFA